jgi:hypothetical protein
MRHARRKRGKRTKLSCGNCFLRDAGQQALKSAKVDYQRVDKAIGQLSDEDLAKVAERSRQAESDFAAGGLKSTLIIVIILIIILIVVLSLVF